MRINRTLRSLSDIALSRSRIWAIDLARGASLMGMAFYHLCWDLAYFGIIPRGFPVEPPMRAFSHVVAGAFLLLVGVSLALAHSDGINWPGYLRRLATVGAAAALVTLATHSFAPGEAIYFGILHCIVIASILALPLVRAAPLVALTAAAFALAAPLFFVSGVFDSPDLVWVGLSTWTPTTLDWRPLLPWSGLVFLGVGVTRLAPKILIASPLAAWQPVAAPTRALTWSGRHSLAIYLVHQPILFGALFASYGALFGTTSQAGFDGQQTVLAFRATCQKECAEGGGAAKICANACQCVVKGLQDADLSIAMSRRTLTESQEEGYLHVVRSCAAQR